MFVLGLVLGAVSGGVTYLATASPTLAAVAGGVAAVLTWCGVVTFLFLDD
ncbi:hypothetical protein ACWENS_05535 [Streptomyces sp. NPDC004532]